jgi:hypothetical protein
VAWQASQVVLVKMWPAFLPAAFTPSWHVAQPDVMPVWLKLAGTHASVEWQVPHSAVVGMWFAPLAAALTPLWHELHVPDTWPWSTRVAGFHALVA